MHSQYAKKTHKQLIEKEFITGIFYALSSIAADTAIITLKQ
jgi:hypothetical protein